MLSTTAAAALRPSTVLLRSLRGAAQLRNLATSPSPRNLSIPRIHVTSRRTSPFLPRAAAIHSSIPLRHAEIKKPAPGTGLKVTYVTAEGEKITVEANEGDNLLDLAHAYDIDLEGACEGSLACSTCHVIVEEKYYDKLEEPSDEENDMLDLAFGLTETSRLGCQVIMSPELDGVTVKLPSATRNLQVDKQR
ncbi:2Fe-2S ferredoxin-type domain-containing protein [Fimicolochytrium jonesii]|uniref:2Fe-2S ferredoxin-type domain-containing protein n=1 Tax=Fimicolochytrium jonesii TaxID=1396493 RepID=UPI0022FE28B4|nr:2Fe-2S ferredoxin-type domain-containing protein [Fimicolochytrium jonesii]KAI8818531.1 2Fe-2S ferredoxin-type domain-containing protein [Fimicolochytrium jonesii]